MNQQRSRWSFRGKLFPVYMAILGFLLGFGVPRGLIYFLDHANRQTIIVFFSGVVGAVVSLVLLRRSR